MNTNTPLNINTQFAEVNQRTESDALGSLNLDDRHDYGIQTHRAIENFSISGTTISDVPEFVRAIIRIKKAAAIANHRLGILAEDKCEAICEAANEYIKQEKSSEFPVDIYHGGGGTAANMNVNEVLANRANEILLGYKAYDAVHPNDHVNMGQSTNDVIPSAMKLAMHHQLGLLEKTVTALHLELKRKTREFEDVVKVGRTCLQDALPTTLGKQFSGYAAAAERMQREIIEAKKLCLKLPLGATAIGTGFGAHPDFQHTALTMLSKITNLPLRADDNLFDALQNADVWMRISGTLKALACNLNKLAADLRLMSSGPRAGLNEVSLPAVQPGSSIMPGKVNPVMPEMVMQVYFRVLGNDLSISRACEGELDINVWECIILHCVSESCSLLNNVTALFEEKCIRGIVANRDKCANDAERSLAMSTALVGEYDYKTASDVAKTAQREGKSVKDVAVARGLLMGQADAVLCPSRIAENVHYSEAATWDVIDL